MRIAIVGGGASGMATAYWLDKQKHDVTVFEKQPILGGHIRTLNKNVAPNQSECKEILENGVLEFPTVFYNFATLMEELGVELEPVEIGSSLLFKDGRHFLSGVAIQKNFTGIQRLIEYLQLDSLYARSAGFILKMRFSQTHDFYDMPLGQPLHSSCVRNTWLKLLTMYSYSIPFEIINNFPAELAIPMLREYASVNWVRIKGGVYSYIEKIIDRFGGKILVNVEIESICRGADGVKIVLSTGEIQEFDKVVFATPPDRVMKLLSDPTEAETKRFSAWQANYATTLLHSDTSMYDRYGIRKLSEFDFFETDQGWGYNASLNQLCGISSSRQYSLAFHMDELIAKEQIIHIQKHHTPLYTVESFRYRNEIIETNGENHTYHGGAYLGDGLHEGAITSALRVAKLIG
ncbi:MAG: FAD-dependent oxidoreductase [Oscillatoriales cyanobacterium]|uniref:FAD-dependent oxidoreductase n=1 Tax=Microcoleus anatoxicus PTRS2 TaxID=2705321 RepID=A0ABU8YTZ1_9CYAN|nr:MAG: FAD-dependent oxidoreductase [Oscillatoriales cyanobacterium]TAD93956.1 MAG: FAD-dependent oxidoreductase [Oscillatoriales cyanobacterium]TAD98898.1 MAG: FAD-dependent oxidoreductase [Oscillatoriales cyanobacterium]TAE96540.1 MAG: FAD-dependent oxidoreductase [Oscillatoriales cyanobacterium]TAF42526.1 MAG: FAD-dependent oxidoreductase [Oscillatoriales cyanobacterium]